MRTEPSRGLRARLARRVALALAAQCATVPVGMANALAQGTGSPYKLHRFDDDFRYLRDPAKGDDPWDPIKFIPLGWSPDAYVTFGGELRQRLDHFDQPFFGLRQRASLDDHLHRLLLNADVHLGPGFRTFIQLGNHTQTGKGVLQSPNDVDRFDLQQAFGEVEMPLGPGGALNVRGGRQEFSFGSQRLVSVGEPPNVRRSFDGVRAFYRSEGVRVDAFVARPVSLAPGYFDDRSDPSQSFWGVYGVAKVPQAAGLTVDLYYLGLDRKDALFNQGRDREERHTVGTRLSGTVGAWDYNAEFIGQVGTFGTRDIRAWAAYFDGGYTLADLPFAPRLGLKANALSGDRDPRDGELNTFNPLFPQYGYFGDSNLVVPANLRDVAPSVLLRLTPSVSASATVDFLWRDSVRDAFYRVPLVPLVRSAQGAARYVGEQVSAELTWQVDRHLSVYATYAHFFAGPVIRDARGKDVDYLSTRISYRF